MGDRLLRIVHKAVIWLLASVSILAVGLWLAAASGWPNFNKVEITVFGGRFLLVNAGSTLGGCWFREAGSISLFAASDSFEIELTSTRDRTDSPCDFDLMVRNYGIIGQTRVAADSWLVLLPPWLVIIVLAALPTRSFI